MQPIIILIQTLIIAGLVFLLLINRKRIIGAEANKSTIKKPVDIGINDFPLEIPRNEKKKVFVNAFVDIKTRNNVRLEAKRKKQNQRVIMELRLRNAWYTSKGITTDLQESVFPAKKGYRYKEPGTKKRVNLYGGIDRNVVENIYLELKERANEPYISLSAIVEERMISQWYKPNA